MRVEAIINGTCSFLACVAVCLPRTNRQSLPPSPTGHLLDILADIYYPDDFIRRLVLFLLLYDVGDLGAVRASHPHLHHERSDNHYH